MKKFYRSHNTTPEIYAADLSLLRKMRRALSLLEQTDKAAFALAAIRLKKIVITGRRDYDNEFFMPERIWITNRLLIEKNDLNWIASLIVHEAFHAGQFKNGTYIAPLDKLERPALLAQRRFLRKLGDDFDIEEVAKSHQKDNKETNDKKKNFTFFWVIVRLIDLNTIL